MYVCLTAPMTDLKGKQAAPEAEDDACNLHLSVSSGWQGIRLRATAAAAAAASDATLDMAAGDGASCSNGPWFDSLAAIRHVVHSAVAAAFF
jgi:hypothetical protein